MAESAATAVDGSAPAAVARSAAADEGNEAGAYSTAALHDENNPKPCILDDDKAEDQTEDNGNVEDDERAKIEEDQMVRETVPSQTSDIGKNTLSVLAHSFLLP